MARIPRSQLAQSGVYHVTARGVDRCEIFLDDEDRASFVSLMAQAVNRWLWRCHAYCLMGNHYHLIVETQLARLSGGFHQLNGTYAQRFNQRHKRVGHLFQDRFHARAIRDDEHLADACAYVWENPVRAGLCSQAHQWDWSGRVDSGARVNR
jgi:REP element-mobilizing transposase RayT